MKKMEKMKVLLNERLNNIGYRYSDDAFDVVYNMIHDYDVLSIYNLYDASDSCFTYWNEAFEYLQENRLTDYKEAVAEGIDTITGIAWFYLMEEAHELLANIGFEEVSEDD